MNVNIKLNPGQYFHVYGIGMLIVCKCGQHAYASFESNCEGTVFSQKEFEDYDVAFTMVSRCVYNEAPDCGHEDEEMQIEIDRLVTAALACQYPLPFYGDLNAAATSDNRLFDWLS